MSEHPQVVLDGVLAVGGPGRLRDLALDQPRERAGLQGGGLGAQARREVRRAGEQVVASEYGDGVRPPRVGGRRSAPDVGLVHDVVVVERGQVGQLDDHRCVEDPGSARVAELRGQQRQQRPEALAAGLDQVARRLGEHRVRADDDLAQAGLDVLQPVLDVLRQGRVGGVEGARGDVH
jgi:hypothetical protein